MKTEKKISQFDDLISTIRTTKVKRNNSLQIKNILFQVYNNEKKTKIIFFLLKIDV